MALPVPGLSITTTIPEGSILIRSFGLVLKTNDMLSLSGAGEVGTSAERNDGKVVRASKQAMRILTQALCLFLFAVVNTLRSLLSGRVVEVWLGHDCAPFDLLIASPFRESPSQGRGRGLPVRTRRVLGAGGVCLRGWGS